jgi:hypothetical protein
MTIYELQSVKSGLLKTPPISFPLNKARVNLLLQKGELIS